MYSPAHAFAMVRGATGLVALLVVAAFPGRLWITGLVRRVRHGPSRLPFTAVGADSLDWTGNSRHREQVEYFANLLFSDQETGCFVKLVRYPAGQINPPHSHVVGHAMYVLKGSLVTYMGTFGPESFVWFPAREVMWHGAGPDEDLVALFMALGKLNTQYVDTD